jgi:hypothetical protein
MPKLDGEALVKRLPAVRGRLEANAPLADLTWFRVGGPAEVLFTPQDEPTRWFSARRGEGHSGLRDRRRFKPP